MQRPEVSCVVLRIYMLLGAKGLMVIAMQGCRFSQWCSWGLCLSGIWHCITGWLVPDINSGWHSDLISRGWMSSEISIFVGHSTLEDEITILSPYMDTGHPVTWCNIPEEWRPQEQHWCSFGSYILICFNGKVKTQKKRSFQICYKFKSIGKVCNFQLWTLFQSSLFFFFLIIEIHWILCFLSLSVVLCVMNAFSHLSYSINSCVSPGCTVSWHTRSCCVSKHRVHICSHWSYCCWCGVFPNGNYFAQVKVYHTLRWKCV